MNHLRHFFESKENVTEFTTLYSILDDVIIRLLSFDDSISEGSEEQIPLPLITIVDGGVRFPLHHLLRKVLYFYGVPPSQLSPNFCRIVMGVIALNGLLEIKLGLPKVRYCYNFVPPTKERSKFYFKPRSAKRQLVQMLPDSSKALEVFSHPSEWEDQVNLFLLQQAWSYRGPPEQQGQGRTAHILLSYVPYYGTAIAIDIINLGIDGGFDFHILLHLQENIEEVALEKEQPQEKSSSLKLIISNIIPPKNFLEIAAARKRQRDGKSASTS
ncbi:hypothetical protein ACSBR2_026613 [Camellia fascicularis]